MVCDDSRVEDEAPVCVPRNALVVVRWIAALFFASPSPLARLVEEGLRKCCSVHTREMLLRLHECQTRRKFFFSASFFEILRVVVELEWIMLKGG